MFNPPAFGHFRVIGCELHVDSSERMYSAVTFCKLDAPSKSGLQCKVTIETVMRTAIRDTKSSQGYLSVPRMWSMIFRAVYGQNQLRNFSSSSYLIRNLDPKCRPGFEIIPGQLA